MEYTNFNHHQLQFQDHQLVASSSPSNCYGVSSPWSSGTILSPSNNGSLIINPRDSIQTNDFIAPPADALISQDLGFQWANSNITGVFNNQSGHDSHSARIKGEFSDSHQKFTEMLQSPPSNLEELHLHPLMKNDNFLKNFSSGCHTNETQFPGAEDYTFFGNEISPSRGNFSRILPTINVSNLNQSSNTMSSNTFDMNMQALDLFNSGRFVDNQNFYKESFPNDGFGHIQQSIHRPSNTLNKMPSFNSRVAEAKRTSISVEPKVPAKKSRSDESRASCPPFKVRKEKLGERIAALQQMVAPFGKTDTASVLMEAIGYIKFLQNQVETLSVPYMKSSRNKSNRTMMQGGSLLEDQSEEPKQDLKSRGICLVPLSCLSYITDGDGGVWPLPNF